MSRIIKLTKLDEQQKKDILELWNNEYPEKLAYSSLRDFENYLQNLVDPTHYLLLDEADRTNGWAMTFIRDNEKWFAIIISGKLHGKGIGTKMLNKLKEVETTLNGWVINHDSDQKANGDTYQSPIGFYSRNHFEIESQTRLELEKISAVKIKWAK